MDVCPARHDVLSRGVDDLGRLHAEVGPHSHDLAVRDGHIAHLHGSRQEVEPRSWESIDRAMARLAGAHEGWGRARAVDDRPALDEQVARHGFAS